jgi:hypothetical protein
MILTLNIYQEGCWSSSKTPVQSLWAAYSNCCHSFIYITYSVSWFHQNMQHFLSLMVCAIITTSVLVSLSLPISSQRTVATITWILIHIKIFLMHITLIAEIRKLRSVLTLWAGRSRSLFSPMTFQNCYELNEKHEAGTTPRRFPASPRGSIECWDLSLKIDTFRILIYFVIHISKQTSRKHRSCVI